jgi:hypothetical protein
MIRSAAAIGDGQRMELELADGRRKVRAEGQAGTPPAATAKPSRGSTGDRGPGGQGQLI